MAKRPFDPDAPFQSIRNAARITGLAQGHIREMCKSGQAPVVMCGGEYRINLPLFMRLLNGESLEAVRADVMAKKEARPSAGTPGQAEMGKATGRDTFSVNDCTTPGASRQQIGGDHNG